MATAMEQPLIEDMEAVMDGLSTHQALSDLRDSLHEALSNFNLQRQARQSWKGLWRQSFLHHSSRWSSLHWPGALLMLLAAVMLLCCHGNQLPDSCWIQELSGVTLLGLLLLSLAGLSLQQHLLKAQEPVKQVQAVINMVNALLCSPASCGDVHYPDLLTPPSQSISLQWTYRDGCLVNLPVSLLVKGDIVALRPGQEAPTSLRGLQEKEHVVLERGDIFCHFSSPPSPLNNDKPCSHHVLQPQPFRVTKTPIVDSVQRYLELGDQRPVSVLDNERFTAQTILEKVVAPLVLALLFIINCTRYFFDAPGSGPWQLMLIQLQVNGILPLLPLTFPLLWLLLSLYGAARVLCQVKKPPAGWLQSWRECLKVLRGCSLAWGHNTSLLHSLGSVTVLCCVDKQGILSFPEPSVDKVLFFTRNSLPPQERGTGTADGQQKQSSMKVLSLSQDRKTLLGMQFDDPRWQQYSSSLIPLGLGTLLGLCNSVAVANIWQLTDHLSNVALFRSCPSFSPIQIPWGTCELAKVLGFSSHGKDAFQHQMSFAVYNMNTSLNSMDMLPWHLPPVTRRKQPLSHAICLIFHDTTTDTLQLFSIGSADIILRECTDLWDGVDIQPLTDSVRKKALDFHQRACIAGQCLAIAFKPVLYPINPELNGMCVQMPSGERQDTGTDSESISEDDLQMLVGDQIFLGLISTQYQARPEMVRLVAGMDDACIRFVWFSLEEEVRSKVFAEKMGLETGWNCHISLQSELFPLYMESESYHDKAGDSEDTDWFTNESGIPTLDREQESLLEDLNRAKLPKGIENVRPHLENIDNVPLLVPLFTDCTPDTMCEMVKIMQEYGEVTCCLGSVLTLRNYKVLLQSDISIALEPLLPSPCGSECGCPSVLFPHSPAGPTSSCNRLLQLASVLCGMPCAVHLTQQEIPSIICLIKQARHTISGIRKCFLFLLQCQLSLVLIQVLGCVCQLPPPLGTSDVICLSCISFPMVSVSLLGKPPDSTIMKVPTGKNLRFLPKKTQQFFILYFLVKFGLTMCTYLACFGFMLHGFCKKTHPESVADCHPHAVLRSHSNRTVAPDWFGEHADGLTLAQKIMALFVLLNGLCTSASHVHRSNPLWKQSPLNNRWWISAVCAALILQLFKMSAAHSLENRDPSFGLSDIPIATWLLGFLWLLPLVAINEAIKLHEIRMRVRYQKRQKLQFDTKLGMNSPF
ncbi:transmembrane protein 94-like [Erpetoichthys calabaricus]|uniref:transmembrane protein 94-like n=1 Tax=Erpetoichthys calabaricus TaxID=27687 RepID=UPI002234D818|nr:transmembrane protein 94-like [Erpetoichthys calabaricus]